MYITGSSDERPSHRLANWIQCQYPAAYARRDPMTHLKLQKLLFYCVGAAMAFDVDAEVTSIEFQAWEHGPVNVDVWKQYRGCGGDPINPPTYFLSYTPHAERVMTNALRIYGALRAWSLRNQSHLEEPWTNTFAKTKQNIDRSAMRAHFKKRFLSNPCFAPEHLQDPGTFRIDGLPVTGYKSFDELASSIYSLSQS